MKKLLLVPLFALSAIATTGVAHANTDEVMDAREADETAVNLRQVSYQCQVGKSVKVTYGFNRQNLPTYAKAYLNGKNRFMPINLARSDQFSTMFGSENNFMLSAENIQFSNYHRQAIGTIQSPANDMLYKSCRVTSVKKLN